jgi:predicted nucleic acid-binding protein
LSDRVFLDANVLVSAAWRADGGLLALWELADTSLITSAYAIAEADRNIHQPDRRTRLYRLVQQLEIVDEPHARRLPASVVLPTKDVPILLAAIEAKANFLVTGDKEHFGRYFGQRIKGVAVLRPRDYLTLCEARRLREQTKPETS